MTETLNSAAPGADTEDWWSRLYDEMHVDTRSHRPAVPAPAARRLPPPGQVVDLDKDDEPEPDDEGRPSRVVVLRARLGQHKDQQHRWRVLVYNGSAAGAGWVGGLVPPLRDAIASCGQQTGSTGAAITIGVGIILATGVLIDRRTRHWWGPLPWICRIPLASAVLALGLYTPSA
jgi:hypothetical protein